MKKSEKSLKKGVGWVKNGVFCGLGLVSARLPEVAGQPKNRQITYKSWFLRLKGPY